MLTEKEFSATIFVSLLHTNVFDGADKASSGIRTTAKFSSWSLYDY